MEYYEQLSSNSSHSDLITGEVTFKDSKTGFFTECKGKEEDSCSDRNTEGEREMSDNLLNRA